MRVSVRLYGDVRDRLGERRLTRELPADATVGDLLARLAAEHEGFDAVESYDDGTLLVRKDGRNVNFLEGRGTPLADGDDLSLSGSPMPE